MKGTHDLDIISIDDIAITPLIMDFEQHTEVKEKLGKCELTPRKDASSFNYRSDFEANDKERKIVLAKSELYGKMSFNFRNFPVLFTSAFNKGDINAMKDLFHSYTNPACTFQISRPSLLFRSDNWQQLIQYYQNLLKVSPDCTIDLKDVQCIHANIIEAKVYFKGTKVYQAKGIPICANDSEMKSMLTQIFNGNESMIKQWKDISNNINENELVLNHEIIQFEGYACYRFIIDSKTHSIISYSIHMIQTNENQKLFGD